MPDRDAIPTRPAQPPKGTGLSSNLRKIDSRTLMAGQNLLMIEHAGSSYYLRMTRNNKLILTK